MVFVSKYIIDTSAMLSQKPDEQYRRTIYQSLWNKIDEMVQGQEIVTCSETASEVQDDGIKKWMATQGMQILPIDDEVQNNVREIVTMVNKDLVDFKTNKSSGDAFLIATAKKYRLSVITEEAVNSPKKIPFTCQKMGIKCMNLLGFMEENGMAL
jgi:predicted nucleic acid-binding protein